ncbi:MAG: veratrol--corrinoid protein metyltransferase [Clostridiales bacterium]|nr:veratrol--corrinoid protein metyltransferase [Clostridiales bacterium]
MISEKDNYLMMLRGEVPEFLPRYRMMEWITGISITMPHKNDVGDTIDEFGVKMATTEASMGAAMPKPGIVLIDDIRKWRDKLKIPDLSHVDWEKQARKDLEFKGDISGIPLIGFTGHYFLHVVNFMSFTEGLCAIQEEPEEVYAMLDYLCEYQLFKQKIMQKYYKIDVICIPDDTAAAQFPFISMQTYEKLILPFYKRHAELALDDGIYVTKHDCGKSECFVDSWVNIGVTAWEPAQIMNDLDGIKKKYGRKLAIMGGWDNTGPVSFPEADNEFLREELYKYVDRFAPGGGFGFMAAPNGNPKDERVKEKRAIIDDVYENYAKPYYQTH